MRRQLNLLSQSHVAFLQGTLEVHILDLFAEIGVLLDQRDETVFHLQSDPSPFLHALLQVALGINSKSLATVVEDQSVVRGPTLYSKEGVPVRTGEGG